MQMDCCYKTIMQMDSLVIPLFVFTFIGIAAAATSDLFINCGSTAISKSASGKEWAGDASPGFSSSVQIIGSSSTRSSNKREVTISVDPVPYNTARISRSQFSYAFKLAAGQKLIRLHFHPSSHNGFTKSRDFFTVEVDPFTLLSNFSASIAAESLSVNTFVKEFCVVVQENQQLNLVFTPTTKDAYAFVNGIEIISVPPVLSYGHEGARVVGHEYLYYIDNMTALEMVHRSNGIRDSVSLGDDNRGGFQNLGTDLKEKGNKVSNVTWRIYADVGFRYLIRVHFCELGLRMAEYGHKDFTVLVNHKIASTGADILRERADKGILQYKNYMVVMKGHKEQAKRFIVVSLHSEEEFVNGFGPIEGFEIFKLSNNENCLASSSPMPSAQDSSSLQSVLERINVASIVFFAVIILVNIIDYMLQKIWGEDCIEVEEDNTPARGKRIFRRFSLAEIKLATEDFFEGHVIGKGGFGKVYKGSINNVLQTVAIKRLNSFSKQGVREFLMEIETLSELRHVNLVPLVGYCNDQKEMVLVYEHMPCGTLADHLYKLARKNNASNPLSWKQRLQICIGAGRGLDYLHTGHGIIHRDVKPSNILLDENFVAKVSDFGLAKIESRSEFQPSTKLKGTVGFIDPDFFKSHKLSTKSDTYAFGVVLLEVLCGRPAVDHGLEEGRRSLTTWAQDHISKGEEDQIVDPSLGDKISPDSLKRFVRIAEKCLLDEPKERPAMAHVVINLEIALKQQENADSSATRERSGFADENNTISLIPNERTNVADAQKENVRLSAPRTHNSRSRKLKSWSLNAKTSDKDPLSGNSRTILSVSKRKSSVFSNVRKFFSLKSTDAGEKGDRKSRQYKRSQAFSWERSFFNSRKSSKRKDLVSSLSARRSSKSGGCSTNGRTSAAVDASSCISRKSLNRKSRKVHPNVQACNVRNKEERESKRKSSKGKSLVRDAGKAPLCGTSNVTVCSPLLRRFSYSELKEATEHFSKSLIVGSGGFGTVYKGWLKGSVVAVKKCRSEGDRGRQEWESEVEILGGLSHPNLVKLLGYCEEKRKLLLVYEFMQNGSLDNHLFGRDSSVKPLAWDLRLEILIKAACGLASLHDSDRQVIHRDFKASNILLDRSYHAKLSDFGLARFGPVDGDTHVTTTTVGTRGYIAPEYKKTGRLQVKSDVYSFGVVLLEMLTGLRVLDDRRPSGRQNLVDWIKPQLYEIKWSRLKRVMDSRMEETSYSPESALQVAQLALKCLRSSPRYRPSMQEIVEKLERIRPPVVKPRRSRHV